MVLYNKKDRTKCGNYRGISLVAHAASANNASAWVSGRRKRVISDRTALPPIQTKRMPESTVTFSVEAVGQVYSQMNEFVYLLLNVNHNADLSIEVNRRIRDAWYSFRKYTLELYHRSSAPLEVKKTMLRAEVLETMPCSGVTWSPRACHYHTLRRAHHSFLTRFIGW